MLEKLKQLLFGKPPPEIQHDFFGRMLFMGGEEPADDDYWECEQSVAGVKEPIAVLVNAGINGPTPEQVAFYKEATADLDVLFGKCWPVFEQDFEDWTKKPFTGNWRDDFELMSIEIPRDANPDNGWHVCYFVDQANHYFTARFVDGQPRYNEIDG